MKRRGTRSGLRKAARRDGLAIAAREVAAAVGRQRGNGSGILRSYGRSYDALFVDGGDARPFIAFLQESGTLFWDLAASISALNHGISVWRQRPRDAEGGRLAAADREPWLEIPARVLVSRGRAAATTAAPHRCIRHPHRDLNPKTDSSS